MVARVVLNVLSSAQKSWGILPGSRVEELQCHFIVLVPAMENRPAGNSPRWWDSPLHPEAIYDDSFGDKSTWPYPFDEIARGKARQLWQGRNGGGSDIQPHLLFSGDTLYWGGVKRQEIVVAGSGFECWIDRMLSGIIAEMLIGLAYEEYERGPDKILNKNFLV